MLVVGAGALTAAQQVLAVLVAVELEQAVPVGKLVWLELLILEVVVAVVITALALAATVALVL
jgi:hypothetical protein